MPSRKGRPNRDRRLAQELAEKLKVDPFEIILRFASNDYEALGYSDEEISPEMRLNAAKEASKYVYAQLKAVDISGLLQTETKLTAEDFLLKIAKGKDDV